MAEHRPTAYGCIYWTADHNVVDWGHCPVCEHPDSEGYISWQAVGGAGLVSVLAVLLFLGYIEMLSWLVEEIPAFVHRLVT